VDVTVTNAVERQRYEARIGGELAGFAEYVPGDEVVTFTHTQVVEEFEGRGVASTLVRAALEDVRSRERTVRAECPFVAGYLERHAADYGDLLSPAERDAGG
jgi:uncharacterized protein